MVPGGVGGVLVGVFGVDRPFLRVRAELVADFGCASEVNEVSVFLFEVLRVVTDVRGGGVVVGGVVRFGEASGGV